CLQSKVAYIF
nr:immunoglobulin light chain junction region [Macaca mulatta]